MSSAPSSFDIDLMRQALAVARRGLGRTAPNPSVGAVVADPARGEILGRGWTQPGGRPHAETEAIRRAGQRARGAVMAVTLEPCAHHGKTPPCADAIVNAGVARVLVGAHDPDPRTAGEGVARMRAAGIEVIEDVLADEARWLSLGHILRITQQRPFVTVKIATDAQGHIPKGDGTAPRWATGLQARAAGHLVRAEADAILVGAGTILADDPDLTCRLPGLEQRSPLRVVLTGTRDIPADARIFQTAAAHPILILHASDAPLSSSRDHTRPGVETSVVSAGRGSEAVREILVQLAGRGITRLLVEGGPAVWRAFAEAGFDDEIALFVAGLGATETQARAILMDHLGPGAYTLADRRAVGGDTLWRWRRVRAGDALTDTHPSRSSL